MEKVERGQWSSKLGFILAASGSAIGLGNIWRFPYIVGENGGAAFVLLYLFFVLFLGVPCIIAELALGRRTGKNPVGAYKAIRNKPLWVAAGFLGVFSCLAILSFYGVIAGWTFGYIFKMLTHDGTSYSSFVTNPFVEIGLFLIFLLFTAGIVLGGVEKGIEKWSKILMPLLLVLMFGLIIYANSLDGSSKGLEFYMNPDFSKLTAKSVLSAVGQAFFSLSLGMGVMITYGSYLPKKSNLLVSSISIAFLDTAIAIMAGLIIFPALFAMGENPAVGPSLVFVVLPKLFLNMPAGQIVGALFFVLLSVAALTSTISMLEVPVSYFVDEKKISRKNIVWAATAFTFVIGLPSALSQGTSDFFTNFGLLPASLSSPDFLSQMSFVFGDFAIVICSLLLTVFIGWVWGTKNASEEILSGSRNFKYVKGIWEFSIKVFVPAIIILILVSLFVTF